MRGLIVLGIALILASSAAAQEKRISVVPPGAAKAGLRGPEGAAQAPDAEPSAALPLPAPAAAPPQSDPSACRTQCAQIYYFCLSGSDDQCPDRWARCVLDCGPVPPPAS